MKKLMKDKRGGIPIFVIGWILLLLLMTFLVMEMGGAFENYDYAVDVLQRACNSAVERNIIDRYRADRVLVMDADGAKADFTAYVSKDMPRRYSVIVSSISCTEKPPSMMVTGKVTFQTMFSQYGFDDLSFGFKVRSTNYDLD